jgi:hypothetical protein
LAAELDSSMPELDSPLPPDAIRRCRRRHPPVTPVVKGSGWANVGNRWGKRGQPLLEPHGATLSWLLLSFGSRKGLHDRLYNWSRCVLHRLAGLRPELLVEPEPEPCQTGPSSAGREGAPYPCRHAGTRSMHSCSKQRCDGASSRGRGNTRRIEAAATPLVTLYRFDFKCSLSSLVRGGTVRSPFEYTKDEDGHTVT